MFYPILKLPFSFLDMVSTDQKEILILKITFWLRSLITTFVSFKKLFEWNIIQELSRFIIFSIKNFDRLSFFWSKICYSRHVGFFCLGLRNLWLSWLGARCWHYLIPTILWSGFIISVTLVLAWTCKSQYSHSIDTRANHLEFVIKTLVKFIYDIKDQKSMKISIFFPFHLVQRIQFCKKGVPFEQEQGYILFILTRLYEIGTKWKNGKREKIKNREKGKRGKRCKKLEGRWEKEKGQRSK